MPELHAAVVSIAPTRRRRFLWAAWWTAPPERAPFRKPDAAEGGARSRDEALRQAEQATGRALVEIEGGWARAWARVLLGEPPFAATKDRDAAAARPGRPRAERAPAKQQASIWKTLGVEAKASLEEIKTSFRRQALATHPDHGGDPAAFREVRRAYVEALRRRKRVAPRREA